jgi:xanthine/CO dehydrogenase XdhC/CoxF family maturation factor
MLDPKGAATGEIEDPALRSNMLAALRQIVPSSRPTTVEMGLTGGKAEVFLEEIRSPSPLVIFGAGYDAVPLVRMAKELGFHVTVADLRPAYALRERFPEADAVLVTSPEEISCLALNERSAAVIMAHNYFADRAFLKALLPLRLRYLGLMGPKGRASRMLKELRQEGCSVLEGATIHNPVGLDIGAENPEQIALAILGEVQAVFSGHAGGSLRQKEGPIHTPASHL